jgi:hypothetical protein
MLQAKQLGGLAAAAMPGQELASGLVRKPNLLGESLRDGFFSRLASDRPKFDIASCLLVCLQRCRVKGLVDAGWVN